MLFDFGISFQFYCGGVRGGSAPQRRYTVRLRPNDASGASQLRSIGGGSAVIIDRR